MMTNSNLSQIFLFFLKKHLAHHEAQNVTQMTQDCWAAKILNGTRMEQQSSPKGPANGLLSSQMFMACC